MYMHPQHLILYEIIHCTALKPCSAHGIIPSRLLVYGEQKSRQRGETARELRLHLVLTSTPSFMLGIVNMQR